MRLVWVIMVCVLLAGSSWVVWHALGRASEQEQTQVNTRKAIQTIVREVRVRSNDDRTELNGRGWPVTIDPDWFGSRLPVNELLTGSRPWVEVAAWDERDLTHPLIRQAVDRDMAAFWYNPGNGVVRARVGVMVSDRAALEVYNAVNGSNVKALVDTIDLADAP